jgi:hypothetical protein
VRSFFTADANGDGLLDASEFLSFVGGKRNVLGDADERLADKCVWESVCHECGMLNAFTSQPMKEQLEQIKAAGGDVAATQRFDLPDHLKPARQRFHITTSGGHEKPPERCEFSQWGIEKRRQSLAALMKLTKPYRTAAEQDALLAQGKPPAAPELTLDVEATAAANRESSSPNTTCLVLQWKDVSSAATSTFPAVLFVLETCGPEGGEDHTSGHWTVVTIDPPASTDGDGGKHTKPSYKFTVFGLTPSTTYLYRIRGVNPFGASAPSNAVPAPVMVKCTSTSVTLCWEVSAELEAKLARLREVFEGIDVDHSGCVSWDEGSRVCRLTGRCCVQDGFPGGVESRFAKQQVLA